MIPACHNCKRGVGDWCIKCQRVTQDDIRIRNAPHAIEVTAAVRQRDYDAPPDRDSAHTVTADLSADAEDKLRRAMASLFSLDPIDLLLVQHLMRGGKLADFHRVTDRLEKTIGRYHGSPRALAWARKEQILHKFPQFRAVITNAEESDAAHRVNMELMT